MMQGYMNKYLDRRMKAIIEEWQLATRNDVEDFQGRLSALSTEVERLTDVEKKAFKKLTSLETRAKTLEAKAK